jgi:hypothetical protein
MGLGVKKGYQKQALSTDTPVLCVVLRTGLKQQHNEKIESVRLKKI